MAKRKPEDIVELVESHYDATEPLRQRMQDDHALYRLEPYDAGEGYQSYTSNEPQTFAEKIINWISGADMTVRIPHDGADADLREKNDLKERFLIGIERSANERLSRMMLPSPCVSGCRTTTPSIGLNPMTQGKAISPTLPMNRRPLLKR